RVVAHCCMFLMSKHSNHRTVKVKYQPGTMIWQMNELLQQSIIDQCASVSRTTLALAVRNVSVFADLESLAIPSNTGTCRWNVGMTPFPADPARALMGRLKPGSSVKHCTGGSASDTSVAERESGAIAALARIRERSRRRQNVSDPCGHRRR